MSRPCSQLNSKRIKDLLQCKIVPIVESTCSVIAVKCVWRIAEEENKEAWKWVCEKRDDCDQALTKLGDISFFFSAISTANYPKSKGRTGKGRHKRSRDDSETEDDGLASAILSQGSNVVLSNDKKLLPAISYWVACQTKNGAAASTQCIQEALLRCDVEVTLTRTSHKKASDTLNKLCTILKDHKNPCMMQLVTASYHQCLRNVQQSLASDDSDVSDSEMAEPENVVRLKVVRQTFAKPLSKALRELREAGLQIDDNLKPVSTNETTVQVPTKPLSCPLTILCHDIELIMKRLGYALHRGDIYKKSKGARYSYGYMCPVKTFLHSLMGNNHFKDRLVQHIQRVLPLLSDPDNCIIRQLVIDRDLVEVDDGWFWSFKQQTFLLGALNETDMGRRSPRAFVNYCHEKQPEPKYFEGILRNSLSEEEIVRFCKDFLGLFRPKEHKKPVPCMIGAANSGKTSLFAPVFQIVPLSRIARVTKQKAFNKAMISPATEVIFLDEAYSGLMDADDWKLLCQGGYVSHDAKWKNAEPFFMRAPMFITCQVEPDFGTEHNDAMEVRLHKYALKSLPSVVRGANSWLTKHAMDCIVWASQQVPELPAASTQLTESEACAEHGGGLVVDEIQRIVNVSVDTDSDCEGHQASGTRGNDLANVIADDDGEDEDEDEDGNDVVDQQQSSTDKLRRLLDESEPDTLKHRQFQHILQQAEMKATRVAEYRRRHLEGRRSWLVGLGVIDAEEANETIVDPEASLPHGIRSRLERLEEERADKERQERRDRAREVYEKPWLLAREGDLAEYIGEKARCTETERRRTFQSLIDITVNKLRMFHENHGTLTTEAVEERRKVCVQHGLLDSSLTSAVNDVYSPLPEILADRDDDDIAMEEGAILTQLQTPPSSQPKQRHHKRARTTRPPRSKSMKGQSRLTSYFKSQP